MSAVKDMSEYEDFIDGKMNNTYTLDLSEVEPMTFDERVSEISSFADMIGVKVTFDFHTSKSNNVRVNLQPRVCPEYSVKSA